MTKVTLVTLAVGLAACGSAPVKPLPSYLAKPSVSEHPGYPRSRYMTAAGFAASYTDAIARASADVAAQIRAEVESETESLQRYASESGESERISVITRVKTTWAHAELIRVVDHEERDGTQVVFVAMNRAEADDALARDGALGWERYAFAVKIAVAARSEGRAGDFDSAAESAEALESAVNANLVLRRAVLGRAPPLEAQYVALRASLEGALAEVRSRRVVDVIVRGTPSDVRLAEYAMKAIRELGFAHIEDRGCAIRAASREPLFDAAELVVEPHETCKQDSLGENCEIEMVFNARGCASGGVGKSAFTVNGLHPADENKARKAAWSKVTYQAVDAEVRNAVRGASAFRGQL